MRYGNKPFTYCKEVCKGSGEKKIFKKLRNMTALLDKNQVRDYKTLRIHSDGIGRC
jgi:hypothetical protein